MRIAGAIFDLDGTVINSLPIVIEAFRKAITRYIDRPITDEEIINLFGPTEEGVLKQVLPDQWQEGLAVYLSEYEALYVQEKIGPYPGIEDALLYLKNRAIRTAIVTGKGAGSTAFSLKHTGLQAYFNLIQTGSPERPVKTERILDVLSEWACHPHTVFYLGDSPSDIQDARSAGVIPLAAAWAGFYTRDELQAEKPEAIFSTPQEFINWLGVNN